MTSHAVDEVVVLKAQTDLCDGPECDALERGLAGLVREGRPVLVDVAGTRFLTARALGVLARAQQAARQHGGRIALCGVCGAERWLLGVTRLAEVLPVYESEQEAVAGLLRRGAAA